MTKRWLSLIFSIAVVFAICLSTSLVFAEGEAFVGKPSPDFVLKDFDGKDHDFASLKGKTILINFWGLRCGACIEEMPHLNALHDEYKDKGLIIMGINADGVDAEFLKGPRGIVHLPVQMNYTLIQDPEMKLIDLFKMEAAPLNILIDKEGVIQYYHMGFEEGDEVKLKEAVAKVIK